MKGKNINTNVAAPRVVTLKLVFKNIYQIFRPITSFKHMLATNQYVATNYCLNNSVINILTTILRRIFMLRVFQNLKTLEDTM